MKQALPQISEAEYKVMKIIWEFAPVNTNEIISLLDKKHAWSPKTIQTMLIRLEKKGAIIHEKKGRVHVYTPLVKKEEYIAYESDAFLNKFFDGVLNQMVIHYLDQNSVSQDEINALRSILERH